MALKDEQNKTLVTSQLYMKLSYTDDVYGALTFYVGSTGFDAGSVRVQPGVNDFGKLRGYLEGTQRSQALIELVANTYIVPSNSTSRYRIDSLFRQNALRGSGVSIYQWNSASATDEIVWTGFVTGLSDYSFSSGIAIITMELGSIYKDAIVPLADKVSVDSYANAPLSSIGKMLPVAYGDYRCRIGTGMKAALFGYTLPAVGAIPVDDKITSGTNKLTKFTLAQNDGTSAIYSYESNAMTVAMPNAKAGDLWISIDGNYAALDNSGYSTISYYGTDFFTVTMYNAPYVWVVLRPKEIGADNSVALTDVYKAIDGDPTNYVGIGSVGQYVCYDVPSVSGGGYVDSLYIALDVAKGANFDLGLYNAQETTGGSPGNYWGSKYRADHSLGNAFVTPSLNSISTRTGFTTASANSGGWTTFLKYTADDASTSVGGSTSEQFKSGTFVGLDATGNEVPIQVRIAYSDTSGTVGIYSVAVIAKMILPRDVRGAYEAQSVIISPAGGYSSGTQLFSVGGRLIHTDEYQYTERDVVVQRFYDPATAAGVQLISAAQYQKDDSSGTYTGSADSLISKAPQIIHHMLAERGGFSVEATSGEFGSFNGLSDESVSGDKTFAPSFYADDVDVLASVHQIEGRWPIRITNEGGLYRGFEDEMNPAPSRFYRSTSDLVRISAKRDIIGGSLRVKEDPVVSICNKATLKYGTGYGSSDVLGSYTYDNPLSQDAFGASAERIIEEPWVIASDLTASAPQNAVFLAKWYGRKNARPRLVVNLSLNRTMYDLKRGHVVQFDDDMEDMGFECPAFRCGLFDYSYSGNNDPGSATNYALSSAPLLVSGFTADHGTWWCASQQFNSITFTISTAGSYSTSTNAWSYTGAGGTTNLANVTCSDGGAANSIFQRTGTITLSFDWPDPSDWIKTEGLSGGPARNFGPGYRINFSYSNPTAAIYGSAVTTYPAKWRGRLFEVVEVDRSDKDGTPQLDVVLHEIM